MENRPQDRPYRKNPKPPGRVVKMKLEFALADALEEMATDNKRDFHNTIETALLWATWAHSCGRSHDEEMMKQPGGYAAWTEKIRARRLRVN